MLWKFVLVCATAILLCHSLPAHAEVKIDLNLKKNEEGYLDVRSWQKCVNRLIDPYVDAEEFGITHPVLFQETANINDLETSEMLFSWLGKVYYLKPEGLYLENPPFKQVSKSIAKNSPQVREYTGFFEFIYPGKLLDEGGREMNLVSKFEYYLDQKGMSPAYIASPITPSEMSRHYVIGKKGIKQNRTDSDIVLSGMALQGLGAMTARNTFEYIGNASDSERKKYLEELKTTLCNCAETPSAQVRELAFKKGNDFSFRMDQCNLVAKYKRGILESMIPSAHAAPNSRSTRLLFSAREKIKALEPSTKGKIVACGRKSSWEVDPLNKTVAKLPEQKCRQKRRQASSEKYSARITDVGNMEFRTN